MPVYEYSGLGINIPDNDSEDKEYFEAAGELRGEPGHGCPWCASLEWEWHEVSGKGTIYSYQIVAHTVLPGFRDWSPYPIVLVELDEQRGQPTPDDGLRITANLLDENMAPEKEENVAIGRRVEVMFMDLENGLTLPQFKLSAEPPQGPVWRHPV